MNIYHRLLGIHKNFMLMIICLEYFPQIFVRNILFHYNMVQIFFLHVECLYRIFMPSNLQMRYVVDSWVEFVSRRKAVTTRESKETGHYICYKYVNGILLKFDDTLVNRVDMLSQYHINLILYRCYGIDAYKWEIDLGFVAHLNQVTYGLRHPPIHGTRYSVWHKDITQDQWQANGSVIDENESNSNVVSVGVSRGYTDHHQGRGIP